MLRAVLQFKKLYPNLIKRAIICKNKYVLIWSDKQLVTVKKWKSITGHKLRVMPSDSLEGGLTQSYWNRIWNLSKPICLGVRRYIGS